MSPTAGHQLLHGRMGARRCPRPCCIAAYTKGTLSDRIHEYSLTLSHHREFGSAGRWGVMADAGAHNSSIQKAQVGKGEELPWVRHASHSSYGSCWAACAAVGLGPRDRTAMGRRGLCRSSASSSTSDPSRSPRISTWCSPLPLRRAGR